MAQYLITYDNKPPRKYDALYRLMATWKAVKLAESVYLVNLNATAGTVRDIVLGTLQRNDIVAVVELRADADWATASVTPAANAWLAANIRPSQKVA